MNWYYQMDKFLQFDNPVPPIPDVNPQQPSDGQSLNAAPYHVREDASRPIDSFNEHALPTELAQSMAPPKGASVNSHPPSQQPSYNRDIDGWFDEQFDSNTADWLHDDVLEDLFSCKLDTNVGSFRPPAPCTYCRHHRLQCLIIRTTAANPNPVTSCSSCVALFRECSLANDGLGGKRQPSEFETMWPVVGQLHGVNEEDGGSISITQISMDEPVLLDTASGDGSSLGSSSQKSGKWSVSRRTRRTKLLREWLSRNQSHPYPNAMEKIFLAQESGLSKTQVDVWFSNARRRRRQLAQMTEDRIFTSGSPLPQSFLSQMTPLERWRHSPPEADHVSLSDLDLALNLTNAGKGGGRSNLGLPGTFSPMAGADSTGIATSCDNSVSSFETVQSVDSTWSGLHSNDERSQGGSHADSSTIPRASSQRYQCTFCLAAFPKKFDWARHEKSVHLLLDSWVCQPPGQSVWSIGERIPRCQLCGEPSPTQGHLASHDVESCNERPLADRTFARKDHLLQHLKKFHGYRAAAADLDIEAWRVRHETIQSRCGFCRQQFVTWTARQEHLAYHFKQGCCLSQWEGDWGFDLATQDRLRQVTLPADRST